MRILVTGAGGFIGKNLMRHLAQQKHEVAGCDMVPLHASYHSADFQLLDIMDAGGLCRWVGAHQPEMVVHLAARTDLLGRSMDDYVANTTGVRNLIAACRAVSSVRRVIFASSRMVCRIDHVPVDYGDYCPPNFYGRSKVEGELLVKAADVPFEWVIVRPTSIWGPGFGIPYRNFFDQVRKGRYVHPGSHRPLKSFGFVENTVWQLERLLLAESAKVRGRTFYLGDYEPLDIVSWAERIHQGFGLPGSIRRVPMPLLWTAAKLGDVLNLVTRADRAPLTSFRLKNLITPMVCPQLSELKEITGDLPIDWRQGTDLTVVWMKTEA